MHDEISWDFIKTLVVTRENKIKALRKAKGFTPSRLAKQAKVDKNHLLALEKSKDYFEKMDNDDWTLLVVALGECFHQLLIGNYCCSDCTVASSPPRSNQHT